MPGQLTEIVILLPRADDCLAVAEDREIPFPVDRKLELLAHLLLIENQLDAGQCSCKCHHCLDVTGLSQGHTDERTQSSVMPNEGIGNWTDHANGSDAETRI